MSKSIYELTNDIDNKFIEEADEYSYSPFFKRKFFKIGTLCASFLIVIISAIIFIPTFFTQSTEDYDSNVEYVGQGNEKTPWDERSIYEKYPSVVFNDINYSSGNEISQSKIDILLGDGLAEGYDDINATQYFEDFTVYSIKGVDPVDAIAVKFDDYDGYHIYRASSYVSGAIDKLESRPDIIPPKAET